MNNCRAGDKDRIICRYVARQAVSEQRLAMTRDGRVRYELKTPYRGGWGLSPRAHS